jgi:alpha-D-ribose 1-methylphosphonate 5-triphosphate synthase subunit PhnI
VLEAITLVRSYRTTLPRFGYTLPVDTAGLPPQRRISATFKDLPGGQQLGATFDYTHRLFADRDTGGPQADDGAGQEAEMPRVIGLLGAGALVEPDNVPEVPTRPRSSRPATASRRRRWPTARRSFTRCRCLIRCGSWSRARPRRGACTRWGTTGSCTSSCTRTSPSTVTSRRPTTTRSWSRAAT